MKSYILHQLLLHDEKVTGQLCLILCASSILGIITSTRSSCEMSEWLAVNTEPLVCQVEY